MLKQQIDQDLKTALLSGNKTLATTLRGLKSVILYAEVAQGVREQGLPDEEVLALLSKEAKKRQESAELFQKGGDTGRAEAELAEKKIIEGYLPPQLSDEALHEIIETVVNDLGASSAQDMGRVIGTVKQKAGSSADGARIARFVKERLS